MTRRLFILCPVLFLIFTSLCFAALTVTQPDGSAPVPAAGVFQVQWSGGAGESYDVYASYNNGSTWKRLTKSGRVTGDSYDWTVPALTANKPKCLVKVVGYTGAGKKVESAKSSLFVVDVLTVTSPGAGERVEAGSIRTVSWSTATQASADATRISYTLDGGATWKKVSPVAGDPGTYDWTAPQTGRDKTCRVKVELWNTGGSVPVLVGKDVSDAFTVGFTPITPDLAAGRYISTNMEIDHPAGANEDPRTMVLDTELMSTGEFSFTAIASSWDGPAGQGTLIPYTLSPNGWMVMYDKRGVVTRDKRGVFGDTNFFKADNIDIALSLPATPGLTETALSGSYVMGSIAKEVEGSSGWAGLWEVTFDGKGNGSAHCIELSEGCGTVTDTAFTYAVADGKFTDSLGNVGAVAPDGKMYTAVDVDDSDGYLTFSAGMRKSEGGISNAVMTGKFIGVTLGINMTVPRPWADIGRYVLDGKGRMYYTELFTSWPPTVTNTATYSVNSDGTFSANSSGSGISGIVLDDGQGFLAVDMSSADEVALVVGFKLAK